MYLGPVVAAEQVLDPSPQTRHPRKEKRGGTSAAAKLSIITVFNCIKVLFGRAHNLILRVASS